MRLTGRDEVRALAAGQVLTEVPFSMRVERDEKPLILRGSIDCLAQAPDGSITVLEFKTGNPRPAHDRQLQLYVEAARALFPGRPVSGLLIHA